MTGRRRADWLRLRKIAENRGGLFLIAQAARCGISKQLQRVRRGVYRLFAGEDRGLMRAWPWTAGQGTLRDCGPGEEVPS